ncbi:MAG: hypothetical protein ACE5FI_18655 [Anaerolineales bacterium]
MEGSDQLEVIGGFAWLGVRFGVALVFLALAVGAYLVGSGGLAMAAGSLGLLAGTVSLGEFVEQIRAL